MHELIADGPAISTPHNVDDFPHRGRIQAEHTINEDRPIEIGFGKPVGSRVEFGVGVAPFDLKRIEVGHEMSTHAIGTDHHQRPDRIEGRTARGFQVDTGHWRGRRLVAVQQVICARRDLPRGPTGALQFSSDIARIVPELIEICLPARID